MVYHKLILYHLVPLLGFRTTNCYGLSFSSATFNSDATWVSVQRIVMVYRSMASVITVNKFCFRTTNCYGLSNWNVDS